MNASTMPPQSLSSLTLHSQKIMVVGVNEVDEMLLRYILQELEADIQIVNGGLAALHHIKDQTVDLVIMNTQLQDQNALELVKKLRQAQEKTLPVVGITAQDHHSRSLFQGFNYIIHRPIEKQKVHRALREYLSTNGG